MGYFFNVGELEKNPCVKKVNLRGMTLTTAFRVQLFQAWKEGQNVEAIVQMLEENGITKELTSDTYALSIESSFKMGGHSVLYRLGNPDDGGIRRGKSIDTFGEIRTGEQWASD